MPKIVFSLVLLFTFPLVHPNELAGQDAVPMRLAIQDLAWSPNGKYLVFSAQYGKADWSDYKPEGWQLILYTVKTKDLRLLAEGAMFGCFSPGSNAIAYSKYRNNNWDIAIFNLHTGDERLLTADTSMRESGPSWSPDGRRLVFYGGRDKARELFVINADGSGLRQISNAAPNHAYNPAWSPTGDKICYYLEKGDNRDQIYLTDSRGSFHQNISQDTLHNYYPGWTPDGGIIHASNDNTLRIMQGDGGGKKVVAGIASFYGRIDPKGKKIAYVQQAGPTQAIALCRYPVQGKVVKIVTLEHYLGLQNAAPK